jgi:hypothetical protein
MFPDGTRYSYFNVTYTITHKNGKRKRKTQKQNLESNLVRNVYSMEKKVYTGFKCGNAVRVDHTGCKSDEN